MTLSDKKLEYGRTFPMYVPPIDWYFLSDDSEEYPMSFYVDLDFSGQLDRERFETALDEAMQRHPLLLSVIQPAKQDKLCWVLAPDKVTPLDWASSDVPLEFKGGDYINIRESTGLRIWVREATDSVRITMQFHHSACDGTGAYRFVGDLLACYMRQLDSCRDKVELGEFDAAQLKVRSTKMRSIRMGDSTLKKFSTAAKVGWQHLGTRVAPLKDPKSSPTGKWLPGMVKRDFTSDQLASLRGAATSQGATMNDLLICKMFQAAVKWNGSMRGGRKLRILVPADMRDGNDFEMPACNMTACTFLTRRVSEINDEAQLLELVRQDMLDVKNGDPQSAFVNAITSAMEGSMLPWIMNRYSCMATSVLSNAGDPSRRFTCKLPKKRGKVSCDEFTLESITGVPPLRRHTRCTLSSSIYGRKLTFSMRCDPFLFQENDSEQLLDLFCDQLEPMMA